MRGKDLAEVVEGVHDDTERVADLMGDAGSQLADGRHFLGLDELTLQPLPVGHVIIDALDTALPAVLDRAEVHRHRDLSSLLGHKAKIFTAQVTIAVSILAELA